VPYVLDGDNLVGTARRRRGTTGEREALVSEVSDRLRRTQARVVLFFDGAGRALSLGNLSVRFAGAVSADDAILSELARALRPRETTVVTADRELARRARDAGAAILSPQDFWDRFGKTSARATRPEEPPVDVEDWMRWFSGEGEKNEE
jgi:predicted RNA-binding protein with PIN domain